MEESGALVQALSLLGITLILIGVVWNHQHTSGSR